MRLFVLVGDLFSLCLLLLGLACLKEYFGLYLVCRPRFLPRVVVWAPSSTIVSSAARLLAAMHILGLFDFST